MLNAKLLRHFLFRHLPIHSRAHLLHPQRLAPQIVDSLSALALALLPLLLCAAAAPFCVLAFELDVSFGFSGMTAGGAGSLSECALVDRVLPF